MAKKRIVCFGPGPQFKGGISNYNTSLAKALDKFKETEVWIVSWTQQYPAIIPRDFIDRTSRSNLLEGTNIQVRYITNYNKPWTWNATYKLIKGLKPDMVIFQWAIALQGLPMGRIARKLKKHTNIEVIFDCHLVIQKEASSLDRRFTRYGLRVADTYITHAQKTSDELSKTFPKKQLDQNSDGQRTIKDGAQTVIKLYHPNYDIFTPDPNLDKETEKEKLKLNKHVFLFFGFIRKYKGLHNVIKAYAKVAEKRDDVSLLIAGESFWNTLSKKKLSTRIKNALFGVAKTIFLRKGDNEQEYRPLELLDELNLRDKTFVHNEFVANEDVHRYFQVSDAIMLYYLTATPSGIESIANNFSMPVLATKVGHFPETIQDGFNGYLAEEGDIDSMAEQMLKMIEKPIPRENVAKVAANMSWENYAQAILNDGN